MALLSQVRRYRDRTSHSYRTFPHTHVHKLHASFPLEKIFCHLLPPTLFTRYQRLALQPSTLFYNSSSASAQHIIPTQPEPARPAQKPETIPESASPASMPAAEGPQELWARLYGTENGSLPVLTHFRRLRTIDIPARLNLDSYIRSNDDGPLGGLPVCRCRARRGTETGVPGVRFSESRKDMPTSAKPVLSARKWPNPSDYELIITLVQPHTPLLPLANFALTPPERKRREGFFRDLTLPRGRIRMPVTKCFGGDRALNDEAPIDSCVQTVPSAQKESETSTFDSTSDNASNSSKPEKERNNGGAANKPVPNVVISESRPVDANQRPICVKCRQRGISRCPRRPTQTVSWQPTTCPLKRTPISQKSDQLRQTKTRPDMVLKKQCCIHLRLSRGVLAPVSRADGMDDRS
jgi:hypothetical protein